MQREKCAECVLHHALQSAETFLKIVKYSDQICSKYCHPFSSPHHSHTEMYVTHIWFSLTPVHTVRRSVIITRTELQLQTAVMLSVSGLDQPDSEKMKRLMTLPDINSPASEGVTLEKVLLS